MQSSLGWEEIVKKISGVLKNYNVEKAAIFGSYSRGEAHRGSDVDLLISFEKLESGLVFAEIKRKLENKLKRKIDLITFNSLDYSDLKDEILAEAKTIYEKGQ